ncbi:unnamed protein product [Orchesella dallaii]|uniref:Uncharacterized protein n=1 Tax=Orchesella dallaii TaxID=48710 RepID=A0ABP1R8Z4_9HEXA
MPSTDVGFTPPSYKATDDFLKRMARISETPFHPMPAKHLVSRYMITAAGDFNFDIPAKHDKAVSIGFFWYDHVIVRRQCCGLLIVNNTEGYAALLDKNPNTCMIQVVQRFLHSQCHPNVMNDFRIVDMPAFVNPILKGSSLLAAVAMYNWVHENSIKIAFRGRFPSESQLYDMGLWAFPRSFRRLFNVRIITNLNREEPEVSGSPNDPMWERFGH